MKRYSLALCLFVVLTSLAREVEAAKANTFNASLFVGDSYAPTNFRLSFWNFDLGFNDIASLYAGTRAWMENYYAGFGLGSEGSMYGLVGYEWRFVPWMGLSGEFDGIMSADGDAAGRVYIGLSVGW
jgi:hypothetical protein